jgi:hypothetical protein
MSELANQFQEEPAATRIEVERSAVQVYVWGSAECD